MIFPSGSTVASSSVEMMRYAYMEPGWKVTVVGAVPEITVPSWVTLTLTVRGTFVWLASGLLVKHVFGLPS